MRLRQNNQELARELCEEEPNIDKAFSANASDIGAGLGLLGRVGHERN